MKSTAERMRELRQRRQRAGLVRVNVWVRPDQVAAVRAIAKPAMARPSADDRGQSPPSAPGEVEPIGGDDLGQLGRVHGDASDPRPLCNNMCNYVKGRGALTGRIAQRAHGGKGRPVAKPLGFDTGAFRTVFTEPEPNPRPGSSSGR